MKVFGRIFRDIRGNTVCSVLLLVVSAFITLLLCFTDYMFVIYDRYESAMIYELGNRIDIVGTSMHDPLYFINEIESLPNLQGYNFAAGSFANVTVAKQNEHSNNINNSHYNGIADIWGNINTDLADEFRRKNLTLVDGVLPDINTKGAALDTVFASEHSISIGDIIEISNDDIEHSITTKITGIYEITTPVYKSYPINRSLSDANTDYTFGETIYPMLFLSYQESCELLDMDKNTNQLWVYAKKFPDTQNLCKDIQTLLNMKNLTVTNSIQNLIDNVVAPMKIAYQIAVLLNGAFLIAGLILMFIIARYWIEKHKNDYRIYHYLGMTERDMRIQGITEQLMIIGFGVASAAIAGCLIINSIGYDIANRYFELSGAFWQYTGNYEQYFTDTSLPSVTGRIFLPFWLFPILIGVAVVFFNIRKVPDSRTQKCVYPASRTSRDL